VRDADITAVMRALRREVARLKTPYVTEVAATEARSPFHVLVSCIISLRTKDDVTRAASERLFVAAPTPEALSSLPVPEIERAIYPAGFYRTKAATLSDIARELVERHSSRVPETIEGLVAMKGVGRKTANLVVTMGYGLPGICVDTHVHRITNRWGYVDTKTPEKTETALREKLPKRYWIPINDLLVAYGQNVCTPLSPHCTTCALAPWCSRCGVERSR